MGAKCCFLGFTVPWKLEQSGTWIPPLLTFQLLQLPWNWALRRPKHLLEKSLGKGAVLEEAPFRGFSRSHFCGMGFGGFSLSREGASDCCLLFFGNSSSLLRCNAPDLGIGFPVSEPAALPIPFPVSLPVPVVFPPRFLSCSWEQNFGKGKHNPAW